MAVASQDLLLKETGEAQARASDPFGSAWVSANAGAGKTHVLKLRVLRLLLAGTPPERILCLTYTKAAAAQMAQRVFDDLSDWATADEEQLRKTITGLLGTEPSDDDVRTARRLFARAIETPGGLKVQTIHAFCERLLQRFPLEAGVPPGFSILDDETGAALRREAIDQTLTEANRNPASPLGAALQCAVARAVDDRFDQLLRSVLSERSWLEQVVRLHSLHDGAPFQEAERYYRRILGVADDSSRDVIIERMGTVLSSAQLTSAAAVLAEGGKRDQQLGLQLQRAAGARDDAARASVFTSALLTQAGAPRSDSQFVSKAIRTAEPAVAGFLIDARDRFHALSLELLALNVVEATIALVRLADRVMQRYSDAKARRAALDFEDLIVRTSNLLIYGEAADWILYKLDGGLDHILVDEAQDTSPLQWTIVESLAAEFYSGESASETVRTVFAVGDEKQSIYSFQGAAPRRFAMAGNHFQNLAEQAGQSWAAVPLRLSFRTVEPLLQAVDAIFADEGTTPGLTASGDDIRHVAWRIGQAGCFEIWPTEKPQEIEPAPAFAPLDEISPPHPAKQLAEKIADRIAGWIRNGEMLVSEGRPVKANDILILVRKRQPFAPEMVRALKARGIAVSGADRLNLTEQIAIQDLLALGDFLVLPEDDLSLAAVLKSPLFDLDDDDLITFAPQRKGSLWSALLAAAKTDPRFETATETLKRWRALSDFAPPYEFFATLLDRDGCRRKLLERLGPDAADPLDEFINLALTYDDQAPASLQGFLCWLREGDRVIKRSLEHGRDEVRVMTVHGAKGLEAPIVFLPDTCTAPGSGPSEPLVDLTGTDGVDDQAPTMAWAIKGARSLPAIKSGRAVKNQEETEEHNRLLYVALTRGRDRIYVAGFEGKRGRQTGCWYDTINAGLDGLVKEVAEKDGNPVLRLETLQLEPVEPQSAVTPSAGMPQARPEWSSRRAPSEPQLVIPLAPSRLAPLETDQDGEPAPFDDVRDAAPGPIEPASPSPRMMSSDNRFLRGILTHALLEHLADYDDAVRESTANRFLELRGEALSSRVRQDIVAESLAVLRDPAFAPVFSPQSRAEVAIVAEIPRPSGDGPPLRLSGQIDRLSRNGDEVLIVDYKTNRPPPQIIDGVAEAYLLQLAAYRLAIKQIFPTDTIRAAILWTDGPRLMPIPDEILNDHQQRLWQLKTASLDGI